jgi:hypothetical protein
MSAVYRHHGVIRHWSVSKLRGILDMWPDHLPAVFVNYDHGGHRYSLKRQLKEARDLFRRYPKQMHEFLIKPELPGQRIDAALEKVLKEPKQLEEFNVIGITEKELGTSLLDKMVKIATLRQALDERDLKQPIHVFGSLDPICCCLYFMAGAEIFDGLTWLRFSYYTGTAIYTSNYGALAIGIHELDGQVLAKSLTENLYYLHKLQSQLRDCAAEEELL